MLEYSKKIEIRWADLDPNFHVLHSKYYDFGAFVRMSFLTEHGIGPVFMTEKNFGPIAFREECVFKKEINFGDELLVNLKLGKCNTDVSRWTMIHELWKNGDTLTAIITFDGAWIDTRIRKLTTPSEICKTVFELIPKTDNYNQ